jgi:amino acid adenylation domain-containing protein
LTMPLDRDGGIDCIQYKIFEAFRKYPSKIALELGTQKYSYQELERSVDALAGHLIARKAVRGNRIGILCENRYNYIVSIIASLKLRCVFVPLDTSYPVRKIKMMVEHVGVSIICCDLSTDNVVKYSDQVLDIDWVSLTDKELVGTAEIEEEYSIEDPIYVYFTSGSTGVPKAIIGKNKSLSQFIEWERSVLDLKEDFRVSQLISPSFDAFLRDVFLPLCGGGTICVAEGDGVLTQENLFIWLEDHDIDLVHCVPSVFRLFNLQRLHSSNLSQLKYVLMSGEELNAVELRNWYFVFGDRIKLLNLYGATETTMIKSFYQIPHSIKSGRVPIGKPIANTQLLVLDEDMKFVPTLVTGEIYVRTPYGTLGYYEQDLNNGAFVQNPFTGLPDDLLYKSGDLGRRLNDGNFEYLGRKDDQIKLRGMRVELGEINSVLGEFDQVAESVVLAKNLNQDEVILCAYFVAPEPVEIAALKIYLSSILPAYMCPVISFNWNICL